MTFEVLKNSLNSIPHSLSASIGSTRAEIGVLKTSTHEKMVSFKKRLATDEGIIRFIRNNWFSLLAYVIAWVVIVLGTGAIYGFHDCTRPLTFGIGVGAVFGGFTGGVTVVWIDPQNTRNKGRNTLWSLLHKGLTSLDDKGTLPIVTSVAVTVLLAFWVAFPIIAGIIFGIFLGNHLVTKIAYSVKKSFNPNSVQGNLDMGTNNRDMHSRIKGLEIKIREDEAKYVLLEEKIIQLQQIIEKLSQKQSNPNNLPK